MAATGKVIGTVTAVVGEAKATAADGTVRILQVGDAVHSDEVISTSAAGSINVTLANGKTLDCGGDADLAMHEELLNVAATAAPSAPAADIEAIQRVIVAGQDPSLVAPATAAGGAPAAGGAEEGGAHTPVIIEQGNSASVVSSGFATEGDSIAFPNEVPQALQGMVAVASNAAPVVSNSEQHAPVFNAAADDHVNAPVSIPAPTTIPAVETNNPVVAANEPAPSTGNQPDAPVVVTSNTPAEEPQQPVAQNEPSTPTSEEPSTPGEEPIIVASNPDQPGDQPQPPVVTEPGNEPQPPVVTPPSDETVPPIVVTENPSEVPETTIPGTVALDYTISANSNQDEQIGRLLFQNGENTFETLVFFGQEGQQKPTSVTLQFDLSEGTSTVKLQYIDAFAGNSDAGTGHTAEKIAIKDFGLTIDGVPTVLAQQNDGVNIGIGNKTLMTEGSVSVDMSTGEAGDWSFANAGSTGVDILDLTGASLNLANVTGNAEVINLQGSAAQELTLNAADVLNVSDGSNVLYIVGGKEDSLKLDSSWTVHDGDASAAGTQASYFGWVQVNHDSGATLLVDPDVNIKGALMG